MRKEKVGKSGRKKMDEREKESELGLDILLRGVKLLQKKELRGERRRRFRKVLGKLWQKKRGVKKIRSAILQPREPGCVPLLQTARKFPLWNL